MDFQGEEVAAVVEAKDSRSMAGKNIIKRIRMRIKGDKIKNYL